MLGLLFVGFLFVLSFLFTGFFYVWMLLESVFFIVLLMLAISSKNPSNIHSVIFYLFVQACSSIMILLSGLIEIFYHSNYFLLSSSCNLVCWMFMLISLLLKLSMFPFYIQVLQIMKTITAQQIQVFLIYPKVIPFLMLYELIGQLYVSFFLWSVLFFFLVVSISSLKSADFRGLLAWSSMSQLSWLFLSIIASFLVFFFFFIMYVITLKILLNNVDRKSKKVFLDFFLNNSIFFWIFFFMSSLSPFFFFFIKLMIISSFFNFFLIFLMLSSMSIFFFYLRSMQLFCSIGLKESILLMKEKNFYKHSLICLCMFNVVCLSLFF